MKKTISLLVIVSLILTTFALFMSGSVNTASALSYNQFTYKVTENTVEILGYIGLDSNLTIPSVINGIPVTVIGSEAFKNCKTVKSITLPDSILVISSNAFANCSGLTSINIPNSVMHISMGAFSDCTSLTSITIPESATIIGKSLFSGCTNLTNVTLPNNFEGIPNFTFKNCTSLTSITIPESVTWIGASAFENCASLTNITIPDSVTLIGYYAFANCTNLKTVLIPNKCSYIPTNTFENSPIQTVYFNGTHHEWNSRDFSGYTQFANATVICTCTGEHVYTDDNDASCNNCNYTRCIHTFNDWTQTKAPTCTTNGEEQRICSNCNYKETRATETSTHNFETPTVIKNPSLTATGLTESKCSNCETTNQHPIPCKAQDENTGISIDLNEGVFEEGTITDFSEITKTSTEYNKIKDALIEKGSSFIAYNIDFTKNDVSVKANGEYTLVIPNKKNIEKENLLVFIVDENSKLTEKQYVLTEENKISIVTSENGIYAVVDKSSLNNLTNDTELNTTDSTDKTVTKSPQTNKKPTDKDNISFGKIAVVITIVVIVAASAVTAIVIIKKKNKSKKQ